jgi:hypothetical protein
MIKTVGKDKDTSVDEPLRLLLKTTDGGGCLKNPYRIDTVKVYFVSREFTESTAHSYELSFEDEATSRLHEETLRSTCIKRKSPVVAATESNISLSGLQEVDGINVQEGDRVLVKDQDDASQNGIYDASAHSWVRSGDSRSLSRGSYVFVDSGIKNIGGGWYLESIQDSSFSFVKFSDNGDPSSPNEGLESYLKSLKEMKSKSGISREFYYKNADVVKVFGGNSDPVTGEFYPAWINPSMVPQEVVEAADNGNVVRQVFDGDEPLEGNFEVFWDPSGCREGDYFVCWTWRPSFSAETLSAHEYFSLGGGVGQTSSLPSHRTDKSKYEMLMDRYTPEMFKNYISEGDLSPLVIKGLNDSVAAGFTMIENLANQIIDLLDSNATHEQLLPLLSNMFALRIKSSDPTLWRRQIKKAVPNFKKKGTIVGLKEAYGDAGMVLLRLSRLWQVRPRYHFQEHFSYAGGDATFKLSREPADNQDGIQIWFRGSEGDWEEMTSDLDSLVELEGNKISWRGAMYEGDSLRVLYATGEVPESLKTMEDYIISLPLMDTRDERSQEYPPKNWNTRVIEEDDPMFGLIVPVKHPISDPTIWGWIRTEFPYSENAYNMEEYNGSKRESLNPCDIGKEFVDPCVECQSSMFNVDLEVESLSDSSFSEAAQVAEEFMPFHSMVHTFNLSGSQTEFVGPAEENIEAMVSFSGSETVLAGEGQHIFNRDLDSRELESVRRDMLASLDMVTGELPDGSWSGTLRNERVCLHPYSLNSDSDLNSESFRGLSSGFDSLNLDTSRPSENPFDSGNLLEVLGSTNRNYTVTSISRNSAEIYGDVNPSVVGPLFEYRISNLIGDFTVEVKQSKRVVFYDDDADFYLLGVVSVKDLEEGLADGDAWTLRFGGMRYMILELLPDGSLLLEEDGEHETDSGWELLNGLSVIKSSGGGSMIVQNFGLVEVLGDKSVAGSMRIGDYVYMGWGGTPKIYRIKSFREIGFFYIEGYEEGDEGGIEVKVYRRIMERKVGHIGYEGILLDSDTNIQDSLPISNHIAGFPSDESKDNYLIFIDSEYYTILDSDGPRLNLAGRLDQLTKSGRSVNFMVYKASNKELEIREREVPAVPSFSFDFVDRSGKSLISTGKGLYGAVALSEFLNHSRNDNAFELAQQREMIDFEIKYREEE